VVSGSSEEMLFSCLESVHAQMPTNAICQWSLTVTCSAEAGELLPKRVSRRYPHVRVVVTQAPLHAMTVHTSVLRESDARYVWLIDGDTVFLPGAIGLITSYLERPENSRVGIVGPQLLNPDGLHARSGYWFPSMRRMLVEHSGLGGVIGLDPFRRILPVSTVPAEFTRELRERPRALEVDTLPGGCSVLRSRAVKQTGLMPEIAFHRGAEVTWFRRFRENGWKVVLLQGASVIHYGGQCTGTGSVFRYPESLETALHFFRTARAPVLFRMFCTSLLAVFGIRAALGWLKRDRAAAAASRSHAQIAWSGLTARVSTIDSTAGAHSG